MTDAEPTASSDCFVGCADLPSGLSRQRYFKRLRYLESSATLVGIPKPSVLKRWQAERGERGQLGLVAPQAITHRPGRKGYARSHVAYEPAQLAQAGWFRDSEVVADAVGSLADAVAAVSAQVVVFRSPADFAPSAANRDAMRAFFRDLAPADRFGGALRVWEPQGLWELDAAARFAGELGLVLACDPLTRDPLLGDPTFFEHLPSDDAYFRVTGLGSATQRLDDYALEPLLAAAESYRRSWLVFGHSRKYPDAIRLQRQLTGEADAAE
ncbi:MAG: hypothetical protein Tsb0020_02830 [Haliangiales bacterium]